MTLAPTTSLFAETALLPDGWAARVRIDVDPTGNIVAVRPGADASGCDIARGPVIPAMPNLHSHAFQRAMAGLAEVTGDGEDSFWTWREAMYRLVQRLTPDDVEAIASRLYVDMLKGGYGAVAEFHYLHHDPQGAAYADPAEMSGRLLAAAARAGIGLTLLPVFYAHGDFGGAPAGAGQRRFLHDVDSFQNLLDRLALLCARSGTTLGLAVHSLRAATEAEMRTLLAAWGSAGPIHIHVAEQEREVAASLAFSGRRPVEFLLDEMPVDAHWCLIHATHMTDDETRRLGVSGAIAGLCPTTEANLGDGLFPAVAYRAAGGAFGIGTDSHVGVGVAEELRLLEYGQRLRDRRRNRLADGAGRSVGADLYAAALGGGARALGRHMGAIAPGMSADLVVLDGTDPFIATAAADTIIDRFIFARGDASVRDVMVAGQWRIRDRRHPLDDEIDRAFRDTLTRLAE